MYDPSKAADYWGNERLEKARNPLAAVLSFSQPDFVNEAYDYWESTVILRILGDINGLQVADIACGVGRMSLRLATAGAEVQANDIAIGMLEHTRAAAVAAGLADHIHLSLAMASSLTLATASCDAAVCAGLMEHLHAEGREQCLGEIARILKPGGRLALVVNNCGSEYLKPATDNPYRKGVQYPSGYFCELVQPDDIEGILQSLGFMVTRAAANLFYSHIRHTFQQQGGALPDAESRMKDAVSRDLTENLHPGEDERFADHFILHCQLAQS
jgi:ubiquinone/menaquinone biosynthesis C-methylase UbiE